MLLLHLFDFTKVVALNRPNGADVPLRTYSTTKLDMYSSAGQL